MAPSWVSRARVTYWFGYVIAVVVPVALTMLVTWLRVPAFLFEHIVVLLVVAIAVPWGLGPAAFAATIAVAADNVLLREPIGQPTITGARDILDLALFSAVAIVISALVRRAHSERAAATAAAQREREAREQRDRLIATVSHDLATPLAVLTTTVAFVKRFGAQRESDLPRLIARLETATARATSLVKTLTDARALEEDRLALERARVNLPEIVAGVSQMMDRFSDRHPIVLAVAEPDLTVDADAERLRRVLENLLNNAIKYSPDGGAVEISVQRTGDDAVVRVRDHGVGIPAEALPHIFERFYRAGNASSHATGLGLGLNIASEIVRLHGGTLTAANADDGGAVFTLRLPTVTGAVADTAEPAVVEHAQ